MAEPKIHLKSRSPSSQAPSSQASGLAGGIGNKRRWGRRAAVWVLANGVGLCLLFGLALLFLKGPLIQRFAPVVAGTMGLPLDRIEAVVVDFPRLTLSGVSLADGAVTLEGIEVEVAGIGSILERMLGPEGEASATPIVRALTIEGLDLKGQIDRDGGLIIPGLTNQGGTGGGFPFGLIHGPISLSGRAALASPVGPVTGEVTLEGEVGPNHLALAGRIAVASPGLTLQGMDWPEGDSAGPEPLAMSSDLDLRLAPDGSIGLALEGLAGTGSVAGIDVALNPSWVDLAIEAEALQLAAVLFAEMSVPEVPSVEVAALISGPLEAQQLIGRLLVTADDLSASLDRTQDGIAASLSTDDLSKALALVQDWLDALGLEDWLPPLPDLQTGAVALVLDQPLPEGLSPFSRAAPSDLPVAGLRIDASDLALPGLRAEAFTLDAAASWHPEAGLSIAGRGSPWRLEGLAIGSGIPVSVLLEGSDQSHRFTITPNGEVALAGGVWVETALADMLAVVQADLRDGMGRIVLRDVLTGPIDLSPWGRSDGLEDGVGLIDVAAVIESPNLALELNRDVNGETAVLDAPLAITLDPGRAGSLRWDEARIEGTLVLALTEREISGVTAGPLHLSLAGLTAPAGIQAVDGVNLVMAGEGRVARSSASTGTGPGPDGRPVTGTLSIAAPDGASRLALASPTLGPLFATLPRLDLSVGQTVNGPLTLTVTSEGGRLDATRTGLSLQPLAMRAEVTVDPEGPAGSVSIPRVQADLPALPDAFSPITIGGQFRLVDAGLIGGGTLWTGPLALPFTARHRPLDGGGRLSLTPTDVLVGSDGIAATDVLPAERFPGLIDPTALSAEVSVGGDIAWGPNGLRQARADFALSNGSLDMPFPTVQGLAVAGQIDLLTGQLLAPVTLTADRLAASLVAEDVSLTLSQPSPAELRLEALTGALAGGDLGLEPVTLPLNPMIGTVGLILTDASLSELLSVVPLEDLSASAPISGTIPVQLTGAGVRIASAALAADGPGTLTYRPEERPGWAASNASVTLLFDALEDFRFERLVATLSGDPLADLTLGLDVEGANPAVYGGYPIALGVNVEGPLLDILGTSLNPTLTEDQIRDLLQNDADIGLPGQ